jgi:hypothetical protein
MFSPRNHFEALNTKVYMWFMTLLIFFWINFEGVGALNSTHPTVFHFFNMDVSVSLDTGWLRTTSDISDAGFSSCINFVGVGAKNSLATPNTYQKGCHASQMAFPVPLDTGQIITDTSYNSCCSSC